MMKTIRYALAAVAISVATHFRWFTGFHILADGDWVIRTPEEMHVMLALPHAWQSGYLGGFNLSAAFYFMEWVHAALSRLGFGYGVIERVEYLWPIVFLTPLGAFLLVRKLTRSDLAAFVASLAYAFNIYLLTKQQSHIYIMYANALTPFALLAYLRAWEKQRWRDTILAGLAWFAVTAADFRIFYAMSFLAILWPAMNMVAERAWRTPRAALKQALHAVAPLALALALNAYWIIGLSSSGSLTSNPILDRGLFGGQLVTVADAMTTWRGEWTDGKPVPFARNFPAPRAWWLPMAALAGLWTWRRSRLAAYFGLMAVIGAFLSKQSDAPLGEAYRWLFAHFPGFKAFRESSKFFVITALGYAALVGCFVAWLQSEAGRARVSQVGRTALLTLLICLPLWNALPLVTGDIGAIFVPFKHRAEYAAFADFLRTRDDFSRVLWVPSRSQQVFESPTHPRLSANFLGGRRAQSFLTSTPVQDITDSSAYDTFADALRETKLQELLDRISVRYVAVALDKIGENDGFDDAKVQRNEVIKMLDTLPFLQRRDIGTGDLVVYENVTARPHLYMTDGTDMPVSGAKWRAVESVPHYPTRHDVTVRDVRGPFVLTFSEQFHGGWAPSSLHDTKLDDLRTYGATTPGVEHVDAGIGLNHYVIDPAQACATFDCVTEADGSTTVRLTLRFRPQAYFDLGFAVTAALFIASVVFVAWPRRRA